MNSEKRTVWLIHGLLALAVGLLFLGAHADGSFSWSDAPRHALNGVFLKDLVLAAPFDAPSQYAYNYYAQYPALTILFYPPLFYVISAPFYGLFGATQVTALWVVALHYVAFAWGSWALMRCWLPAWHAAAAAALLVLSPEIAVWGRQVMLEVPALAFMTWSAAVFTWYRRSQRPLLLYIACALLLAAMYTKITAGVIAVAYAATLLAERRRQLLKDKHIWIAVVASLLLLVPLLVLTAKFGQANVQSVTGIADSLASRRTLSGWLWYARQLPGQLGWPMLAAAAGALLVALARRSLGGLAKADLVFWAVWLVAGYVFFSCIDLKEARHSVLILPPIVFLVAWALSRWHGAAGLALAAALLLAVVVQTALRPVPYVKGYAEVASYIARHAPRDSSVLFSGYRDGSFVFNMRSHEERRDMTVVRADKMLMSVAVRRELGVKERAVDEAEIIRQINELNVSYLVVQPGFWNDLAVMQRFERAIAADQFQEVARFPTPANVPTHEKELVVYRNLKPSGLTPSQRKLDLPIINRSLEAGK